MMDKILAGAADDVRTLLKGWSHMAPYYGSPIEHALGTAIQIRVFLSCPDAIECILPTPGHLEMTPDICSGMITSNGRSPVRALIATQVKVGSYRADFFAACKHDFNDDIWWGTVIECDGHDFHERTKEQAAHDRSRDRWMQAAGYKVLRFTGAEIHADPYRCATEALDAVTQCAWDSFLERKKVA